MLAYKFQLKLNIDQKEIVDRSLDFLTSVWNDNCSDFQTYPNYCSRYNKTNIPKYLYSQCVQQELKNLHKSWKVCFKNHIGKPKVKRRNISSFAYPQYENISFHKDNTINLPKVGYVKYYNHSHVELENIKQIIIKKEFKHYYIIFVCDIQVTKKEIVKKDISAYDFNLKTFLVSDESKNIEIPNFYNKSLKRIQQLSKEKNRRRTKGKSREEQSNSCKKTLVKLAKTHRKIENQRKDFLHKISKQIANESEIVVIEKLSIAELVNKTYSGKQSKKQQRLTRRKYYNSGFNRLAQYLTYKCDRLVEVNPRYTSKMCHVCNYVNHELTLNDRKWECCNCRTIHNRDHNAAKNILRLGKYMLEYNIEIEWNDILSIFPLKVTI